MNSLVSIAAFGVVTFDGGDTADFKLYLKRPNLMRIQMTKNNEEYSKIYDGKNGYISFKDDMGTTTIRPITGDALDGLRQDANLDGKFYQISDEPQCLEIVGLSEVNGEPAYEILIAQEAGFNYQRMWIHEEHFYEMKMSRTTLDELGAEIVEELIMSDFTRLKGVWAAKRISRYSGDKLVQDVKIDRFRHNIGLFNELFEKPESE